MIWEFFITFSLRNDEFSLSIKQKWNFISLKSLKLFLELHYMKKSIFLTTAFALLAIGSLSAQDLDTVSIADQFNTGERGNLDASAGFTTTQDGTLFAAYSGADATGTINYINAYTGPALESPVVDVTTTGVSNVDRAAAGVVIAANTRPGATGGATAVLVCDDGGQNTLAFGENNDGNYFVEVDVFVYDRTAIAGTEVTLLGVRCSRDGVSTGGAYQIDRDPSYYIAVNHHTLLVEPRFTITTGTSAGTQTAGTGYTSLGTPVAITAGWHTLKIEANGTNVNFFVDGASIGSTTTATTLTGRAALGHRELSVATADEITSVFDNLKAGPIVASVNDWSLYSK